MAGPERPGAPGSADDWDAAPSPSAPSSSDVMAPAKPARQRLATLGYEEPARPAPLDDDAASEPEWARGARPIGRTPLRDGSAPELTVHEGPIGRTTLAAIEDELDREAALPHGSTDALSIAEVLTFVLQGSTLPDLETDATRREFVATRLLHRLPVYTLDDVLEIEVRPAPERGTLLLRVWCRIG